MHETLACYQRCLDALRLGWPRFASQRTERLAQEERHGIAPEKVAENVLEDLFTVALDWTLGDVDHQVGYADMLLTRLGIKYLLIEAKRPGALAWNRTAVDAALAQARRYAAEQSVQRIAVSDGVMLYAADIEQGGLGDRVYVDLTAAEPDPSLWWLSVHGIYRDRDDAGGATLRSLAELKHPVTDPVPADAGMLTHAKYHLPMHCFA